MPARIDIVRIDRAPAQLGTLLERRPEPDGLPAPVRVLTRSRATAMLVREQLVGTARRALVGVSFETAVDLARRLAEPTLLATGRRRLSRPVLAGALRRVLRSTPGSLAAVAEHGSTEDALVDAYEDLRWGGAALLEQLAATRGLGGELARWFRAAEALLADGFYDDAEICAAASERLLDGGSWAGAGQVIAYLPERLRPRELTLLEALSTRDDVVVVLARCGDVAGDMAVEHLAARLAGLPPLAAVRPDALALAAPLSAPAIRVAKDPAAEVRAGLASVLAALERGAAPERCALLYASPEPYLSLIWNELAALDIDGVGVPAHGPSGVPLSGSPSAVVLERLFALGSDEVLERRAVFELLAASPGTAPGAAVLGAWERCSRLAGIVAGPAAQWRWQLEGAAAEARERGDPSLATDCEALADVIEQLAADAGGWRADVGWAERSAWARRALARYLAPSAMPPGEPPVGHEGVLELLDTLAALEGIDRSPSPDEYAAAFSRSARRRTTSRGRPGCGLLIGDLDAGVGGSFELVVVLGAAEGNLPARSARHSLLASGIQEQLETDDLPLLARERRRLALALASASTSLVSYPQSDGRARQPCRWLAGPAPAPLQPLGDFGAAADEQRPVSAREAAVLALAAPAAPEADRAALVAALGLSEQADALAARAARHFGRYSGDVAALGAPVPRLGSATALEHYAACPFRYFLRSVLGCEVLEEPERRLALEPKDRGVLVHDILQRFVAEQLEAASEADGDAATPGSKERLADIAREQFRRFERRGLTGKALLWEHEQRQILSWLDDEREALAERRRDGTVPIAVEHAFGYGGVPPVSWPSSSAPVEFRGRIDRVDRSADGTLLVIDYKTGSPDPYRGLRQDPVNRGRHLQLPIYALAARTAFGAPTTAVRAAYRMVGRSRGEFEVSLDSVTTTRFGEVLEVITGGIQAGVFPMRPGAPGNEDFENCRFCDYTGVCPSDRRRQWETARRDERLGGYVTMVEGQAP
ncbi:MAG: PD-(D/E)XK nuclease family protein [Actinomycetota bacterium]|nr:PD-(D/E)XK nuclease family protein [Actinomycetota bacterium]